MDKSSPEEHEKKLEEIKTMAGSESKQARDHYRRVVINVRRNRYITNPYIISTDSSR